MFHASTMRRIYFELNLHITKKVVSLYRPIYKILFFMGFNLEYVRR